MAARKFPVIFAVLLAVSVGVTAARVGVAPAGAATDGSVVLAWNQQVLDAIVATKTGPTIAARALAVVHTAIYDAWAAYDAVAVPTIANGNGRRPPAERTLDNKDKAVSFAAYAALVDLFPTQQDAFYRQMTTTLGYDPAAASPTPRPPRAWARWPPGRCWPSATRTAPTS
jgi:hypothetical protein